MFNLIKNIKYRGRSKAIFYRVNEQTKLTGYQEVDKLNRFRGKNLNLTSFTMQGKSVAGGLDVGYLMMNHSTRGQHPQHDVRRNGKEEP